jgi:tetratricopeptide (TPR) repeat protein
VPDLDQRKERAQVADDYYATAISLSPNSALLWNEWASLDIAFLDDPDSALEKIDYSLELDPKFDRTYALLGDYHANRARLASDDGARVAEYRSAAEAYEQAVEIAPDSLTTRLALGAVYSATGEIDLAIEWYTGAMEYAPPDANLVNVYRALADLHHLGGDEAEALHFAELALASAPEELRPEIQRLIDEIRAS